MTFRRQRGEEFAHCKDARKKIWGRKLQPGEVIAGGDCYQAEERVSPGVYEYAWHMAFYNRRMIGRTVQLDGSLWVRPMFS